MTIVQVMLQTFFSRIVLCIFILFVGWDIALHLSQNHTSIWHYLFNAAIGFLCLFGAFRAFQFWQSNSTRTKEVRSVFLLFIVGLTMYAAAFFSWTYYNIFTQAEIPYPSLADIFFVVFYPLMLIGMFRLLIHSGAHFTIFIWIQMIAITTILFILLYSFLSGLYVSEYLPVIARIFNFLYPALDVLLIAFAVGALRTTIGTFNPSLLLFIFGFIGLAFADTVFSYRTTLNLYWNGDVADVLYLISTFLLVLGIDSIDAILHTNDPKPDGYTTRPVIDSLPIVQAPEPETGKA